MRSRLLLAAVAPSLVALTVGPLTVALGATPAGAQAVGNSGFADSYGLSVNATLLAGNVPVTAPPLSRSTSDCPPVAPAKPANLVPAGPIPAGGELVQNASAVSGTSSTDCGAGTATATGSASNVQLFATANLKPMITADVLKGVANSSCSAPPDGKGSAFVHLSIGGNPVPASPPPNTVIPLGVLTVIVNEQHPADDGRGFVVNALHVFGNSAAAGLFTGDLIIGHAFSSVSCANGAATTGAPATNPIVMVKTATPTSVDPGGSVTYSVAIKNNSKTNDCLVNSFVDHLSPAFNYQSTAGDLGSMATPSPRPGGGQDIAINTGTKPVTIPKNGGSKTQTFTVMANSDAAPGTYYNNIEILCSDLGNFVARGAPVTINATPAPTGNTAAPAAQLPRTGGPGPLVPLAGGAILAGAVVAGSRRRILRTRQLS
ncbi:MAG: hypothetical protein NVS3B12_10030 [Acidimicrobiales bacterium]